MVVNKNTKHTKAKESDLWGFTFEIYYRYCDLSWRTIMLSWWRGFCASRKLEFGLSGALCSWQGLLRQTGLRWGARLRMFPEDLMRNSGRRGLVAGFTMEPSWKQPEEATWSLHHPTGTPPMGKTTTERWQWRQRASMGSQLTDFGDVEHDLPGQKGARACGGALPFRSGRPCFCSQHWHWTQTP